MRAAHQTQPKEAKQQVRFRRAIRPRRTAYQTQPMEAKRQVPIRRPARPRRAEVQTPPNQTNQQVRFRQPTCSAPNRLPDPAEPDQNVGGRNHQQDPTRTAQHHTTIARPIRPASGSTQSHDQSLKTGTATRLPGPHRRLTPKS